jgi:hypothetical protein
MRLLLQLAQAESPGATVIYVAEWRGSVPEREHQRVLLGRGVFNFDGRQLRFASSLAAAYAAEQLPSRLPQAVLEQHKQLKKQAGPGWW